MDTNSFHRVSCDSPKILWKLCLFIKCPHQEIRWNDGILHSVYLYMFFKTKPFSWPMCDAILFIGIVSFSLTARNLLIMRFSWIWTDYYIPYLNICCLIYFIFCFNILFANSVQIPSLENPGNSVWKSFLLIVLCCDSKMEFFCYTDFHKRDDEVWCEEDGFYSKLFCVFASIWINSLFPCLYLYVLFYICFSMSHVLYSFTSGSGQFRLLI